MSIRIRLLASFVSTFILGAIWVPFDGCAGQTVDATERIAFNELRSMRGAGTTEPYFALKVGWPAPRIERALSFVERP